ncbi:MAG: CHAT domain-containing protein [Dermatophilaceae bacterium]
MHSRSYLNFDVAVALSPGGGYEARVLGSPAGQTEPVKVAIPLSDLQIENFLLRIGRPRRGLSRSLQSPEAAAIRSFGGVLFDAVFRDQLRTVLATSQDVAESQGAGLRVRLRLTEAPELVDLPWEYLYNGDAHRFVALSEWTPLVRYLELPGRVRPLAVEPPVRLLVMVASPTDYPALDVESEWTRLREALRGLQEAGRVQVERVPGGSLADLQRQLRRGEYHVFHFIGHGAFDAQADDGVLAFEGAEGRGQLVSGSDLGTLLHDHRTLRLVLLNSCEGARAGRTDPYSGTAQSLVRQGIPAVVAMQFEITDEAAITLAQSLYEAVADGYPLDAAMSEARKAVKNEPNPVEWGTPVLYLRAEDARVFDMTGVPEEPAADDEDASVPGALAAPVVLTSATGPTPPHTRTTPPAVPGESPGPAANRRAAREAAARDASASGGSPRRRIGWVVAGVAVVTLVVLGLLWARRPPDVTPGPTDTVTAVAPTVTTVNVPGNQALVDAGVACSPGRALAITATGTVRHNTATASDVGPDGAPDPTLRQFNVPGLSTANHAALIGSLDRTTPFVVGSALNLTCRKAGELFLGVNDVGVDNNAGAFVATITQR